MSIADEAGQPALFPTIRRAGTMYCRANTMQYDDDGERLRRISCADRDAFEQLYLDYHKRLYGSCAVSYAAMKTSRKSSTIRF